MKLCLAGHLKSAQSGLIKSVDQLRLKSDVGEAVKNRVGTCTEGNLSVSRLLPNLPLVTLIPATGGGGHGVISTLTSFCTGILATREH